MRMFPELAGKPCGYVNLNKIARPHVHAERSQFLDASVCQKLVDDYHASKGLAYSYGGYMEDRSDVWKGGYQAATGSYLHLGVDFNVRGGTLVAAPRNMRVLMRLGSDYPEAGGWGPRVISRCEDGMILIFAHLHQNLLCTKSDELRAGEVFAMVGRPPYNGDWYEHMHVQSVEPEVWPVYENNLHLLDGYGRVEDIERLRAQFPDPLPSLGHWQ